MIAFALGRYGDDDYRLVKWDGTDETEVGTGWPEQPTFEQCINAVADFHDVGDTPFPTREGMIDSQILTASWPVSVRFMTLADETMPWDD